MAQTQTQAEAEAKRHEVLGKLGPGWVGEVWENIGWHVAWHNGALKLHYEPRTRTFWAMVGEVGGDGGHMDLTATFHRKDPIKAVLVACKYAQAVIEKKWKPIELSVATIILKYPGGKLCTSGK